MLLNCGVGEDSWESLGLREIQPVNPKGNQSWIFIGRTDVEAETPIFWPPDAKNWLIWKDPDAGKDWRWEEKGVTEDEVVRWHHWLNGHEFEWTLGVGDEQGGLVCRSPWGRKELDMTEQLNWTELNVVSWKLGNLRSGYWHGIWVSRWGPSFSYADGYLLTVYFCGAERHFLFSVSLIKALIPSRGLCPHNLITS